MPYQPNDIVTLKLVSGEEIVTRFLSETADEYAVYKPLSLMQGPQGMALMQSLMSGRPDREIIIRKSAVAMHAASREEIVSAWIEGTSGLKTPGKSSLLMG